MAERVDKPSPPRQKRRQQHRSPRLCLVICNIQKISNVKAMVMAAVAFGCSEVLVVGQERNSQRKDMFPAPFREAVQKDEIRLHRFAKWRDCVAYMDEQSIFLIGVEIDETSRLLNDDYFERYFPAAAYANDGVGGDETTKSNGEDSRIGILLGNEGQGIQPVHQKRCNGLVRIPQYGAGTASMNVNVATNIVLYRFQNWKRRMMRRNRTE